MLMIFWMREKEQKEKIDLLKERLIQELWAKMEEPQHWGMIEGDHLLEHGADFGHGPKVFRIKHESIRHPLDCILYLFGYHGYVKMEKPIEWDVPKRYYVQFRRRLKKLKKLFQDYHDENRIKIYFGEHND